VFFISVWVRLGPTLFASQQSRHSLKTDLSALTVGAAPKCYRPGDEIPESGTLLLGLVRWYDNDINIPFVKAMSIPTQRPPSYNAKKVPKVRPIMPIKNNGDSCTTDALRLQKAH